MDVGDFLKKVPYDPQKLLGQKNFFQAIKSAKAIPRKVFQVILVLCAKAQRTCTP
jgi:hypothetical protein